MKLSKLMVLGFTSVLIAASHGLAGESTFFVNQRDSKKGTFQLTVSRERTRENTLNYASGATDFSTSTSNVMALSYAKGIDESSSFSLGTTFVNRNTTNDSSETTEINGFRSLQGGYKYGQEYDAYTLLYGGDVTMSTGAGREPFRDMEAEGRLTDYRPNNALGYHSLAPYVGIESYVGEFAMGANATLMYNMPISDDNGNNYINGKDSVTVLKLGGFIEIPMETKWDLGIFASSARNDSRIDQTIAGSRKNETATGIYTNYRLSPTASLSAQLKSEEKIYPFAESSTDLGISYRKAL